MLDTKDMHGRVRSVENNIAWIVRTMSENPELFSEETKQAAYEIFSAVCKIATNLGVK